MLFVSDLKFFLHVIQEVMINNAGYRFLSAYEIDFDEREAVPFGQFGDVFSLKINQLKCPLNGCPILAISVSPDMSDLYKLNMVSHLKALEADLDPFLNQ